MAVWVSVIASTIICSLIYMLYNLFSLLNGIEVIFTEDDVEGLEQDFKNGLRNLRRYD